MQNSGRWFAVVVATTISLLLSNADVGAGSQAPARVGYETNHGSGEGQSADRNRSALVEPFRSHRPRNHSNNSCSATDPGTDRPWHCKISAVGSVTASVGKHRASCRPLRRFRDRCGSIAAAWNRHISGHRVAMTHREKSTFTQSEPPGCWDVKPVRTHEHCRPGATRTRKADQSVRNRGSYSVELWPSRAGDRDGVRWGPSAERG
jgi:hypothetical protein